MAGSQKVTHALTLQNSNPSPRIFLRTNRCPEHMCNSPNLEVTQRRKYWLREDTSDTQTAHLWGSHTHGATGTGHGQEETLPSASLKASGTTAVLHVSFPTCKMTNRPLNPFNPARQPVCNSNWLKTQVSSGHQIVGAWRNSTKKSNSGSQGAVCKDCNHSPPRV